VDGRGADPSDPAGPSPIFCATRRGNRLAAKELCSSCKQANLAYARINICLPHGCSRVNAVTHWNDHPRTSHGGVMPAGNQQYSRATVVRPRRDCCQLWQPTVIAGHDNQANLLASLQIVPKSLYNVRAMSRLTRWFSRRIEERLVTANRPPTRQPYRRPIPERGLVLLRNSRVLSRR